MQMLIPFLTGSATAGGAAAAGAGAAAAGGFSFSKMLMIGGGVVSGLAKIAQGRAEASALEDSAEWEDFNASRELTKGRAEALEAMEAANDAIAAAQVAGFASGLQGSGSVLEAKRTAMEDAEFQIGMSRANAEIAAGARRGQARRFRADAGAARRGGVFGAIGSWGNVFSRLRTTG